MMRAVIPLSVLDLLALRTAKGDVIYAHCIHTINRDRTTRLERKQKRQKTGRRLKKQKIREWIAERLERKL